MNVFPVPTTCRAVGLALGLQGQPDQICSYSGGTFHLKSETGNKQGNKHVTIQFQLEEALRWERGADVGMVVPEGF